MFTGIIESVGTVVSKQLKSGDLKVEIHAGCMNLSDVNLGDSIAVNGVCLTVVELRDHSFWADISQETITMTCWGEIKVGEPVNLEKALLATSRLGGHMVSGHVDGIGKIVSGRKEARSIQFEICAPDGLAKYIAHKGSITIDGVSLTVNRVEGDCFWVNIVPHTAHETTLAGFDLGRQVHLEVDLIARYIERLLTSTQNETNENASNGLTEDFLSEHGFA